MVSKRQDRMNTPLPQTRPLSVSSFLFMFIHCSFLIFLHFSFIFHFFIFHFSSFFLIFLQILHFSSFSTCFSIFSFFFFLLFLVVFCLCSCFHFSSPSFHVFFFSSFPFFSCFLFLKNYFLFFHSSLFFIFFLLFIIFFSFSVVRADAKTGKNRREVPTVKRTILFRAKMTFGPRWRGRGVWSGPFEGDFAFKFFTFLFSSSFFHYEVQPIAVRRVGNGSFTTSPTENRSLNGWR